MEGGTLVWYIGCSQSTYHKWKLGSDKNKRREGIKHFRFPHAVSKITRGILFEGMENGVRIEKRQETGRNRVKIKREKEILQGNNKQEDG